MANEFPSDLIQEVQILLRKEGGVGSYDPDDPSLPNPPTLEAVIAEFDLSPDSIRCEHCRGKLLRGSESMICVYCGREKQKDWVPQPISFKSTIGFRWLLESLGLDGSEIVGPPIEDTQTHKAQSSPRDEIALCDFLDLKLKWPDESERFGVTYTSQEESQGKRSLNLAGVYFSDFLSKEERVTVSGTSTSKQLESNESDRESQNFPVDVNNLFQNQQAYVGSMKPDVTKDCDSFSGWEADFQSASSVAQHEDLKSSEFLKEPTAEYASHMDTVFGYLKDAKGGKAADVSISHVPSGGSLENDSNSKHRPSIHADQSEVNLGLKDDRHASQPDNPSSTSVNWLQEEKLRTSNSVPPDHAEIVLDDSIDARRDIKVLTGKKDSLLQASSIMVPKSKNFGDSDELSDGWGDFASSSESHDNQHESSSVKAPDDGSSDAWNDFTSKSSVQHTQSQGSSAILFEESTSIVNGNVFDVSDNFTGLPSVPKNAQANAKEKIVGTNTCIQRETINLWSEYGSSTVQTDKGECNSRVSAVSERNGKVDDSFDVWNDFISISAKQISPNNPHKTSNDSIEDNKVNNATDNAIDFWLQFPGPTLVGDDKQQSNGCDVPDHQNDGKEDSFGAWNDFKTSTGASRGAWDVGSSSFSQSSFKKATENKSIVKDDDSLNLWSDFQSPAGTVDNNLTNSDTSGNKAIGEDDIFEALFESPVRSTPPVVPQQLSILSSPQGDSIVKEDVSSELWSHTRNSASMSESQRQTSGGDDFLNGWNNDAPHSTGELNSQLVFNNKLATENDDSIVAWTDFSSSVALQEKSSQTSQSTAVPDEMSVKGSDPFDAWNALMNYSNTQSSNPTLTNNMKTSPANLLSPSSNLQDVGVSSSLQTDIFSGSSGDRSGFIQLDALPSEDHALSRPNDGRVADQSEKTEDASFKETSNSKSTDAETLISEMHDLSFMLESKLTVPEK